MEYGRLRDRSEQADIHYDTREDSDIKIMKTYFRVSFGKDPTAGMTEYINDRGNMEIGNILPNAWFRKASRFIEILTFVIQSHEQRNNIIGGILLQHTTTESCHLVYT